MGGDKTRVWGATAAYRTRACAPASSRIGTPLGREWALKRDYLASMGTIVMRARLLGGEHADLTYEDPDQADEDAIVSQIIETLSADSGVLRCRHGERLVALYARGVATIEVSPRGAIL